MPREGWQWWMCSAGTTTNKFKKSKKKAKLCNKSKCKDKYVLCRAKELALADPDPQLFTMATLTGHAVLAVR